MSVVEKAAEKLKAQQQAEATPGAHATAPPQPHADPLPERSQERAQQAGAASVQSEVVSPWHLDLAVLKRRGLLPDDGEADGRLTDELRRVKRPLLDNVTGKSAKLPAHGQRIVVTSAVPGEGKTFTTLNLALSFAREPDFEVLLVDGDIPKSDVTRGLGLEGRPGLMDLLVDEQRRAADVIVQTDVPNLFVLPSGAWHPLAAELFSGRRMDQVLEELGGRNRRRLLVFDSSPLLATAESQTLVAHMGQVVMVVAAGRTRQQEVRLAMENLHDAQYVGFVLNMSRLPASESSYYSQYGYYQTKSL